MTDGTDTAAALSDLADIIEAVKIEADCLPPIGPLAEHTQAILSLVQDAERVLATLAGAGQPLPARD